MAEPIRPAEMLVGRVLPGGWVIAEQLQLGPGHTGGNFSVPYRITSPGDAGGSHEVRFLKALDLTRALETSGDVVDALNRLTEAYGFERDLVLECADRRMKNVVLGLDAGSLDFDEADLDPVFHMFKRVPYIVFECADCDVRGGVARGISEGFDEAWAFRVLHGAANGLGQLHQASIEHQDLKPSNVMSFPNVVKVGDLGRASPPDGGLFDDDLIAGDPNHAPPELLYRERLPDDRARRRACDMYHLGSMAVFVFTGANLTSLLSAELEGDFHWSTWPRDYWNALPYVREAHDRLMARLESELPPVPRHDLASTIRELSDPDPLVRGHTRFASGADRYNMERYVSIFDRLAVGSEMRLRRVLRT